MHKDTASTKQENRTEGASGTPRSGNLQYPRETREYRSRERERHRGDRERTGEWDSGRGRGEGVWGRGRGEGGRGRGRAESHGAVRQAGPRIPAPVGHAGRPSLPDDRSKAGQQDQWQVMRRPDQGQQQQSAGMQEDTKQPRPASGQTNVGAVAHPAGGSWAARLLERQPAEVKPSSVVLSSHIMQPLAAAAPALHHLEALGTIKSARLVPNETELAVDAGEEPSISAEAVVQHEASSLSTVAAGGEEQQQMTVDNSSTQSPSAAAAPSVTQPVAATAASTAQKLSTATHPSAAALPKSWASVVRKDGGGQQRSHSIQVQADESTGDQPSATQQLPPSPQPRLQQCVPSAVPVKGVQQPLEARASKELAHKTTVQEAEAEATASQPHQHPAGDAEIGMASVQEQVVVPTAPCVAVASVMPSPPLLVTENVAHHQGPLAAVVMNRQPPASFTGPAGGVAPPSEAATAAAPTRPQTTPPLHNSPTIPSSPHAFTFTRPGGLVVRHQLPAGSHHPPLHPEAAPPARMAPPAYHLAPHPSQPPVMPGPVSFPLLPHMQAVPMLAPAWAAHVMPAPPAPGVHGVWARPHPGVMLPPPHPQPMPPHMRGPPPGGVLLPAVQLPFSQVPRHAFLPPQQPYPPLTAMGLPLVAAVPTPPMAGANPTAPPFVPGIPYVVAPLPCPSSPLPVGAPHFVSATDQPAAASTMDAPTPALGNVASSAAQSQQQAEVQAVVGTATANNVVAVAQQGIAVQAEVVPAAEQAGGSAASHAEEASDAAAAADGAPLKTAAKSTVAADSAVQNQAAAGTAPVAAAAVQLHSMPSHQAEAREGQVVQLSSVQPLPEAGVTGCASEIGQGGGDSSSPSVATETRAPTSMEANAEGTGVPGSDVLPPAEPVATTEQLPAAPTSWAARLAAAAAAGPPPADHRKHLPQRLPGRPHPAPAAQQHHQLDRRHEFGQEGGGGREFAGGRGIRAGKGDARPRQDYAHSPATSHKQGSLQSGGGRGRGGQASYQAEHRSRTLAGRAVVPGAARTSGNSNGNTFMSSQSSRPTREASGSSRAALSATAVSQVQHHLSHGIQVETAKTDRMAAPSNASPSNHCQQHQDAAVAAGLMPAKLASRSVQPDLPPAQPPASVEADGATTGNSLSAAVAAAAGNHLLPDKQLAWKQPTDQNDSSLASVDAVEEESGDGDAESQAQAPVSCATSQAAAEVAVPAGITEVTAVQALEELCRGELKGLGMPTGAASMRVQPRGMLNPGNLCFMNSIFQALMGGGQFCHVLATLHNAKPMLDPRHFPTLAALAELSSEFETAQLPTQQLKGHRREQQSADKGSTTSMSASLKGSGASPVVQLGGQPLMPSMLMDLVTRFHRPYKNSNGRSPSAAEAEQQDASEFLDFVVDAMHQEMLVLRKMQGWVPTQAGGDFDASLVGDGWLTQSGRRAVKKQEHKSVEEPETPISALFRGRQESSVTCMGVKPSLTVTPFTAVHLHIHQDNIRSVADALDAFSASEAVHGYKPDARSGPVVATKTVKLARLPPILVLHLMRFEFGNTGSAKVSKHLSFDMRLAIKSSWLSKTSRDRGAEYQLVATVNHHGRHSSMGHYTADVLQPDDCWLRFDDGKVFLVDKQMVLSDRPYLLFYQRVQQQTAGTRQ